MIRFPRAAALPAALALAAALAPAAAAQLSPELPRTHAPRPTTPQLTAADLMTRLYILADDSMMGRAAGERGNVKGTDYVAAEFRRAGLEPAGEGGTFFQAVPLVVNGLEAGGTLQVDGATLQPGRDFVPAPGTLGSFRFPAQMSLQGAPAVFGGRVGGETLPRAQAAGKVVVLLPALGANGQPNWRVWREPGFDPYPGAAAVVIAILDDLPPGVGESFLGGQMRLASAPLPTDNPPTMLVSTAAAERILGAPPAGLRPGAAGRTVRGAWRFVERPTAHPARNVIGLLRGSDPAVRDQYVVISAHNDHEPNLDRPVDHDSVRAYNAVMRPQGANDPVGRPTPEQAARIAALRDSLRRVHGGVRMDSVMNGADDDGSGTVVLMEIAEELAKRPDRPRRSILFVSHTAEEAGLLGSQHFTDHPTVPRDSIVAALNMDMVGRGRANEVARGGPRQVQMMGMRRLSTALGDLIDSVNARRSEPMAIDATWDAPGHPLNRYCRSDHYMYARYGIPITYFSHGYTVDYHQAGDEPQYIDYEHMARTASFVRDIALAVAGLEARLPVDKPKPDPNAPCRQ